MNWDTCVQLIFNKGGRNKEQRKESLHQVVLEKVDIPMQINEVRTFPHTIYKNKLKMLQRPKYKTRNYKNPTKES